MTTSGRGENSHNIRYLSQGDTIYSIRKPNQGWQVVTLSDFCHKVVVTISNSYCTLVRSADIGTSSLYGQYSSDKIDGLISRTAKCIDVWQHISVPPLKCPQVTLIIKLHLKPFKWATDKRSSGNFRLVLICDSYTPETVYKVPFVPEETFFIRRFT